MEKILFIKIKYKFEPFFEEKTRIKTELRKTLRKKSLVFTSIVVHKIDKCFVCECFDASSSKPKYTLSLGVLEVADVN